MAYINLIITEAGIAEIVNAEKNGTAPVVLTEVGIGTGKYTASSGQTALQSEFKRMTAVSGGATAENILHISCSDSSADAYAAYEVGIYSASGTLFAVCSQTDPIFEKAEHSQALVAFDIMLTNVNPDSVMFGDTNLVLNAATTEEQGIVELATEAEAKAGTDTQRAVTPKALDVVIEGHDNIVHRSGAETIAGTKTFNSLQISNSSPYIRIGNNGVVKGTTPESSQYWGISFSDSEGYVSKNRLSLIETVYGKDGNVSISMGVYKPEYGNVTAMGKLSIIYPANGNPYATAPTPAAGDNSTKIATTAWVTVKAKEYLPLTGGNMTGAITLNNGESLKMSSDAQLLRIMGGADTFTGGGFLAMGKDNSQFPGYFYCRASTSETENRDLIGKPDGTLTWGGLNIVRCVNGVYAEQDGNVIISISNIPGLQSALDGKAASGHTHAYLPLAGGKMTSTKAMSRNVANSFLGLHGGTGDNNDGAQLYLCGASHPDMPGMFQLHARNSSKVVTLQGDLDGRLTWDDKYVLNNSFMMPTNGGAIMMTAGTSSTGGAYFRLYGKDHASGTGQFVLVATDGTNSKSLTGKPDGSLNWNGKSVETVDSVGSNYIRYVNGLQICWGEAEAEETSTITLPKAFVSGHYYATANPLSSSANAYQMSVSERTTTSFKINSYDGAKNRSKMWLAIGKWK